MTLLVIFVDPLDRATTQWTRGFDQLHLTLKANGMVTGCQSLRPVETHTTLYVLGRIVCPRKEFFIYDWKFAHIESIETL